MIYFILVGFVFISFVSLGARSLKSFSRHQLEDLCQRRKKEGRLAEILKEYDRTATAAGMFRLLLTTILVISVILWLAPDRLPIRPVETLRLWIVPGLVIVASLLLAEVWLSRAVSKLWGTHFVYVTWPLWRGLAVLMFPLTLVDRFVNVFFHRLAGKTEETDEEEAFEDEIRTMVTEGHREGLLEEDAREMIEGVIELSDFIVSEIMTPRTDMVSISSELSWDDMLKAVIGTPHSRIPVYRDNRDDIIGVIHSKDLLRELAQGGLEQCRPWTDLMKEPLFVPETKPVDTLLQEFQNTKHGNGDQRAKGHLAIVLDEYGGVSGIVTLEDILEEIVGEIIDEHDPMIETEEIHEIGPDRFESLGKVRIDDLNETLNIELPEEEDYDTVAGFIFSTLGHVPEVGETVDFQHETRRIRFTVLAATRRRIEKVLIELNPG